MLRGGLATRGEVCKHATSVVGRTMCPLQMKRSASVWQNKGGGSKATMRIRKTPSRLDIAERETKMDIRELKAKLAAEEKTREAKKAHEALSEVDEDTLDLIYSAINVPDPATPEELRIEAKRRRMLLDRRNADIPSFGSSQGDESAHRLASLHRRIVQLQALADLGSHVGNESEKEMEVKAYDRVSFLLSSSNASREIVEGEEASKGREIAAERAIRTDGNGQSSTTLPTSTSALQSESITAEVRAQHFREDLLARVHSFIAKMLSSRKFHNADREEKVSMLPLGIATQQEWEALATSFAQADDMTNVLKVLQAVEQSGHGSLSLTVMNAAMDVYAQQGHVKRCQALAVWMTENQLKPDHHTHHCLVKSFLRAGRIASALNLISQLEEIQPASLATYTMALTHLLHLHESNPAVQSRIWSLFNRMRLVAHPIPDALCYAVMIRACAIGIPQVKDSLWNPADRRTKSSSSLIKKKSGSQPDTERALDLFREMTNRYNIRPSVDVYSALIDCCVGRPEMYEKAWQLFRNMVEMDRLRMNSKGKNLPSTAPNRKIFNLLLTGCRKNGDLLRARWILAEMLRSATLRWKELMEMEQRGEKVDEWMLQDVEQRRPDEKTMSEMFLTYAKPPHRADIAIKTAMGAGADSKVGTSAAGAARAVAQSPDQLVEADEAQDVDEDTMTYRLPSSRKALLREATSLMERIKLDHNQKGGLLSSVRPGVILINSYLKVVANHSHSIDVVERLRQVAFGTATKTDAVDEKSLFETLNVEPDGSTCMVLLQCLGYRGGSEGVLEFIWEVWDKWITMGGDGHHFKRDQEKAKRLGLSAAHISSTWAAMIHILARDNHLDQAMQLLRKFADLYPPLTPSDVALLKEHTRASTSTSSSLLSPIRGEDIARLQKRLPPMPTLAFDQLKVLHMRLVESERHAQDISYLKWLVLSYNPASDVPDIFRSSGKSLAKSQVQRLLSERETRSHEQPRADLGSL